MSIQYASAAKRLKSKPPNIAILQSDAIPINRKAELTAETLRQADLAFDQILRFQPCLGRYKLHDKRLCYGMAV